jgi:hypothetical protein
MNAGHATTVTVTVTVTVTTEVTSPGQCRNDRPGAVQPDRLWFTRRLRVGASICQHGAGLEVSRWARHPSRSPVAGVHNSS